MMMGNYDSAPLDAGDVYGTPMRLSPRRGRRARIIAQVTIGNFRKSRYAVRADVARV